MRSLINTDEYFANLAAKEKISKAYPMLTSTLTAVYLLWKYKERKDYEKFEYEDTINWDSYNQACFDLSIDRNIFSNNSFFQGIFQLHFKNVESFPAYDENDHMFNFAVASTVDYIVKQMRIFDNVIEITY